MAKRRAEIEEEQEVEEEKIRNARFSVSNEGETESKGKGEGTENVADGDVEMREEVPTVLSGKDEGKRNRSRDPENGVGEERRVREKQQDHSGENMDEEEGEVD